MAGYSYLKSKGLLLDNITPLVQLTIMYPFALWGSTFSDLDHNPNSIPSRDIVSIGVNKILHLTTSIREGKRDDKGTVNTALGVFDAKHRSWQTHSDLFLILVCLLAWSMLESLGTSVEGILIRLIFLGFILGVVSHLILDMLTPEGIWSILGISLGKIVKKKVPEKISFVPHWKFFSTGGKWEDLIRWLMWVVCILIAMYILYDLSPYRVEFNFLM